MIKMRKCKKCGIYKPLSDYCKDLARKEEKAYKCRECSRKWDNVRKKKDTISGIAAFTRIKQRCENPKVKSYKWYGAKGIKVIISKSDFIIFYNSSNTCALCKCQLDDNNRLKANGKTVDRINSKGNYEVNNLRLICRSCNTKVALGKPIAVKQDACQVGQNICP